MKFIRKKPTEKALTSRTKPVEKTVGMMDITTYYKVYLQSYLRWLFEQNMEFADTLTTEEITNFLLQKVKHPLWFDWYCNQHPLQMIADTTTYLGRYKKHANQMAYRMPIVLIQNNPYLKDLSTIEHWVQAEDAITKRILDAVQDTVNVNDCLPISTLDSLVYVNLCE